MAGDVHAYHFSATAIQPFILAGGKLRHMVGASEMVEMLAGDLLDKVLEALGLDQDSVQFARRGGAAFTLYTTDPEPVERLQGLWTLAVRQFAPGLPFRQARGAGADARAAVLDAVDRAEKASPHPFLPPMPSAGPFVERAPRTGQAAEAIRHEDYLDAAQRQKEKFTKGKHLTGRIHLPNSGETVIWPVNMDPEDADDQSEEAAFPFIGEQRNVAIIHADGNGMGGLLSTLRQAGDKLAPAQFPRMMMAFSQAIAAATERAARTATALLTPHKNAAGVMPARPLVLGGDDLTILVRADLALDVASSFLREFEEESAHTLAQLQAEFPKIPWPERMTACAGVAFVKATLPFSMAHRLSESLCHHAKAASRRVHAGKDGPIPASLAFHRITTSIVDDYQEIIQRELTTHPTTDTDPGVKDTDPGVKDADPGVRVSMQPYAVHDDSSGLPSLTNLRALTNLLRQDGISSAPPRQLLTLIHSQPGEARKRYQRWRDNLDPARLARHGKGASSDRKIRLALDDFDRLLGALLPNHPRDDLPAARVETGDVPQLITPLADVQTLLAVEGQAE